MTKIIDYNIFEVMILHRFYILLLFWDFVFDSKKKLLFVFENTSYHSGE